MFFKSLFKKLTYSAFDSYSLFKAEVAYLNGTQTVVVSGRF